MPPATHRLSILLLPASPETPPDAIRALVDAWRAQGFLEGLGPGPRAAVAGGFSRARVSSFEQVQFASNWQGGFAVACPRSGAGITGLFATTIEAWRRGAPRALACACGHGHDLADLTFAPEAGFARGWLTLADVADAALTPEALSSADAVLGGVRVVLRRG